MAYNKLKSRRFWIAIWAIATVTSLMLVSMKIQYDPNWLDNAVSFLLGIIGAYISIEGINKPKMKG